MGRYAVIGASRGTGLEITHRLSGAGHQVRAIARTPPAASAFIEPFVADVTDKQSIADALNGSFDAVFYTVDITGGIGDHALFGSPTKIRETTYQGCVNSIAGALKAPTKPRFVLLSIIGVDQPSMIWTMLNTIKPGSKRNTLDKETAVKGSGLSYVILRAPKLNDGPGGVTPISATPPTHKMASNLHISRADLAQALVSATDNAVANTSWDVFSSAGGPFPAWLGREGAAVKAPPAQVQQPARAQKDSSDADAALLPGLIDAVQATGDHLNALFSYDSRPADRGALMTAIHANDDASVGVLKAKLTALRPAALWVDDEEDGGALPAGECWIVDPVEGNINHIHGLTEWGVTATLVRDNVPVLAAVYLPMTKETYSAVRGGGAFMNGKRLNTSAKSDLNASIMATGQAKPREESAIYRQIGQSVTAILECGSLLRVSVPATLLLVEVARGRMDGFWQFGQVRVGLLAGALLVEEAGGLISDVHGHPWTTSSSDFLATAPAIHAQAVKVLSAAS